MSLGDEVYEPCCCGASGGDEVYEPCCCGAPGGEFAECCFLIANLTERRLLLTSRIRAALCLAACSLEAGFNLVGSSSAIVVIAVTLGVEEPGVGGRFV